jgi:hypothetical protein
LVFQGNSIFTFIFIGWALDHDLEPIFPLPAPTDSNCVMFNFNVRERNECSGQLNGGGSISDNLILLDVRGAIFVVLNLLLLFGRTGAEDFLVEERRNYSANYRPSPINLFVRHNQVN